jgi:phage/plasmid-associated DNA primase
MAKRTPLVWATPLTEEASPPLVDPSIVPVSAVPVIPVPVSAVSDPPPKKARKPTRTPLVLSAPPVPPSASGVSSSSSEGTSVMSLQPFLLQHSVRTGEGHPFTHTRIFEKGRSRGNLQGTGLFYIDRGELPAFYDAYHQFVFVDGQAEMLTEKQLSEEGPLLVDLDFQFDTHKVTERLHTSTHISDLVGVYFNQLTRHLAFVRGDTIPVWVMEKPTACLDVAKHVLKDGIHLVFGVQVDRTLNQLIRQAVLDEKELETAFGFEDTLLNSWDTVVDDAISKGTAPWPVYGSHKPHKEPYRITYQFEAKYTGEFFNFNRVPLDPAFPRNGAELARVSAHNITHLARPVRPEMAAAYAQFDEPGRKRRRSAGGSGRKRARKEIQDDLELESVTDAASLETMATGWLQQVDSTNLWLRELHRHTQILPAKYYEPGSHALNLQVGLALRDADFRMFWSWVMLRAKASDFDFESIPDLYHSWTSWPVKTDGITFRSIFFWAKQDAPVEYNQLKKENVDFYIEATLNSQAGDWDFAKVLHCLYKDSFVCSQLHPEKWYRFDNHRWEPDQGLGLRSHLSTTVHALYFARQAELLDTLFSQEEGSPEYMKTKRKLQYATAACRSLKESKDKNRYMAEARELFFNAEFEERADRNPYLLGFVNGVMDFSMNGGTFRDGTTHDYITMTTGHEYVPFDETDPEMGPIATLIHDMFAKIFPRPNVRRYMWDHLASALIGVKKGETLTILRGSGANGKSMISDLMRHAIKDYMGIIPIQMLTEKRTSLGAPTPELMMLRTVRYAVSQEPSLSAVLNEGVVKELSGGDPVQGRNLFGGSETFLPQFTAAVNTNYNFKVVSDDDGTWRRIKIVRYISKFRTPGEQFTDQTEFVYDKDLSLKSKLKDWSWVFLSMLVQRAIQTQGVVEDCPEVLETSLAFRASQNVMMLFINECLVTVPEGQPAPEKGLNRRRMYEAYKDWHENNQAGTRLPKMVDVCEAVSRRFGEVHPSTKVWTRLELAPTVKEGLPNASTNDSSNSALAHALRPAP